MAFKKSFIAVAALAGAACAVPACSTGTADTAESPAPSSDQARAGKIGFAITVNGVTLESVDYEIDNGSNSVAGTIDVSQPGSTISAEVGVVAGTGYTASLSGSGMLDGSPIDCSGTSTGFDVVSGQETAVAVTLVCVNRESGEPIGAVVVNGDVEVETETCPVATAYSASPLQVDVGGIITLAATASTGGTIAWSSASGSGLSDPTDTSYECTSVGPDTITLTVGSSEPSCSDVHDIAINCTGAVQPDAGTGAGGSPGAGGAGAGGDPGSGGAADVTCEDCLNENCDVLQTAVADTCAQSDCTALQACLDNSDCDEVADPRSCYCGDVAFTTCFASSDVNLPNGDCRDEINSSLVAAGLVPLGIPSLVAPHILATTNAVGANIQLAICTQRDCSGECL